MAFNMRDELIKASRIHFKAHIEKHRMNVENLLNNSVGVAEHPDLMDSIENQNHDLDKFTNQIIFKITNNLENFHYNVIIANIYEIYNFLNK